MRLEIADSVGRAGRRHLREKNPLGNILDEIVSHTRDVVAAAKSRLDEHELRQRAEKSPVPSSFLNAISGSENIALIAEVKKASPSKGLIRADFDPLEIATAYQAGGASCISVLTDEKYFQGHLDFLTAVANEVTTPLLRKDFILDPYQVYEARLAGASGVLLIAECLSSRELKELHDLIVELKMTPLVEFHDAENLEKCVDCGAKLIGVNNRDLATFHTDLNHVIKMRPRIPADRCVVAESGIFTFDDVQRLEQANIQAMLVGESLMRQPNIRKAVRVLLGKA